MKRKIIKQGHNTFTITLPSKWTQSLNIKPGDEVEVVENNSSLIINSKQHFNEKKTAIDITGMSVPMIWRFFQSAYREGHNEIKIIYDPSKKLYQSALNYYTSQFEYSRMGEKPPEKPILEMIQQLVDRFIGIEIMDHGENEVTIREMGDLTSKEFDNSLRRIFLLILELFDTLIELIKCNKVGDIGVCKTLHQMDINVDRFID
jgi:phosphate uptake regulator